MGETAGKQSGGCVIIQTLFSDLGFLRKYVTFLGTVTRKGARCVFSGVRVQFF